MLHQWLVHFCRRGLRGWVAAPNVRGLMVWTPRLEHKSPPSMQSLQPHQLHNRQRNGQMEEWAFIWTMSLVSPFAVSCTVRLLEIGDRRLSAYELGDFGPRTSVQSSRALDGEQSFVNDPEGT